MNIRREVERDIYELYIDTPTCLLFTQQRWSQIDDHVLLCYQLKISRLAKI